MKMETNSEHKHRVFNLIILDESGSMQSIKNLIISGFNEVVQTVKGVAENFPEQEHSISLLTFNGLGIKTHFENVEVSRLHSIDGKSYQPNSLTPLFDAMGTGILHLKAVTDTLKNYNVLVTILTDGEENASTEFSGLAIKNLVEELKMKNWTFTYIGANQDVEAFAISVSITNTMKFETNEEDIGRMFKREKVARMRFSEKIRKSEDTSTDFYSDDKKI